MKKLLLVTLGVYLLLLFCLIPSHLHFTTLLNGTSDCPWCNMSKTFYSLDLTIDTISWSLQSYLLEDVVQPCLTEAVFIDFTSVRAPPLTLKIVPLDLIKRLIICG